MSEETNFNGLEIKEKALTRFKNDYKRCKNWEKNKYLHNQFQNLSIENIEILEPIYPVTSRISYTVSIFHATRFDDGTYGKETMEGIFDLIYPEYFLSYENLDEISTLLIKTLGREKYSGNTYNGNEIGFYEIQKLEKFAISLFERDNEIFLYNHPGKLRAAVKSFTTQSQESLHGYYPISAKIKNLDGKTLYFLIDLYEDSMANDGGSFPIFGIMNWYNPIIFDEAKKIYTIKKGLFNYKIV